MRFSCGLPAPFHDETLTSWLYRISLKRRIVVGERELLLARPRIAWAGANPIDEDLDFDFSTIYFKKNTISLALNEQAVKCFFSAKNIALVNPGRRTHFCSICLREDIIRGQMPGWRKSWCARDAVICSFHGVDLSDLGVNATFRKGWDAYIQSVQPNIAFDPWLSINFQRLRRDLIQRIKLWCKRQSKRTRKLFFNLYDLFLLAPTYNHEAGVARFLFGRKPSRKYSQIITFENAILHGAELSDIKTRFGGQVLAAYVLGGIQEKEILKLRASCISNRIAFPKIEEIIPMIHFGCATLADYEYLHNYLGRFPRKAGSKLDCLFARFEKNIGSRIFHSQLRFGR
ncbi:TniQ family protein [Pseudomonas tolaasii]|uniref:TniQ family protein n=1 Tax=Pseudomonas tolaasii TaxID=29442 RepID=UPI001C527388|nr:TniQ family protein [Pseudomonas tolaasii]QXQ21405.1 TniQ family protein [Pseudomonas tolaasii]